MKKWWNNTTTRRKRIVMLVIVVGTVFLVEVLGIIIYRLSS